MATRGPLPGTARTESRPEEWTTVDDVPFEAGRSRPCPVKNAHPGTVRWWETIRVMPHCVLWSESDWIFAEDLATIKERFYQGALGDTAFTEMRRREDQIGTTVEARRKLRIRYKAPAQKATASAPDLPDTGTTGSITNIADRRARLLGE